VIARRSLCENQNYFDEPGQQGIFPGQQKNSPMIKPKHVHLYAVALLVIGCSTSPTQTDKSQVNLAGYPPSFRDGYKDGCDSSRRAAGTTRDETRFEDDAMYAAGWRDGFDICSEKKYE